MKFFQLNLGKKNGIPGVVLAIQSFGDYARWHPHLHALVADDLFLESGYIFVMPKVNLHPLSELFRAHVLKMLKKEAAVPVILPIVSPPLYSFEIPADISAAASSSRMEKPATRPWAMVSSALRKDFADLDQVVATTSFTALKYSANQKI